MYKDAGSLVKSEGMKEKGEKQIHWFFKFWFWATF